jgi:hypothetical protein
MFNRPKNGEVLRGYTTDNLKNDRAKKLITSKLSKVSVSKISGNRLPITTPITIKPTTCGELRRSVDFPPIKLNNRAAPGFKE